MQNYITAGGPSSRRKRKLVTCCHLGHGRKMCNAINLDSLRKRLHERNGRTTNRGDLRNVPLRHMVSKTRRTRARQHEHLVAHLQGGGGGRFKGLIIGTYRAQGCGRCELDPLHKPQTNSCAPVRDLGRTRQMDFSQCIGRST